MKGEMMLEATRKSQRWTALAVILSLLLFLFAIPHTLEDFAVGEPAKKGVSAPVLSFVVAALFATQGLALYLAGRQDRRGYYIQAGLGILWPLAAGLAQLPVILSSGRYRAGFISVFYVAGVIVIGILLLLASLRVLRTGGGSVVRAQAVSGKPSRNGGGGWP